MDLKSEIAQKLASREENIANILEACYKTIDHKSKYLAPIYEVLKGVKEKNFLLKNVNGITVDGQTSRFLPFDFYKKVDTSDNFPGVCFTFFLPYKILIGVNNEEKIKYNGIYYVHGPKNKYTRNLFNSVSSPEKMQAALVEYFFSLFTLP